MPSAAPHRRALLTGTVTAALVADPPRPRLWRLPLALGFTAAAITMAARALGLL